MSQHALSSAAALVLLISGPGEAFHQPEPDRQLDEAKDLYRQGRFDDAIGRLREAIGQLEMLRDLEGKRTQLADAHFLLGLTYLAVRDEPSALENFKRTVVHDPHRTVDPEVFAPKVVNLYEEARKQVQASSEPEEEKTPAREETKEPPSENDLNLDTGTRMRATLAGADEGVVGSLFAVDGSTLTLVSEYHRTVELPRDMIAKLEVSDGKKGHALVGLLSGVALGAVLGAVEKVDQNCIGEGCFTKGENIGYGALGGGVVGALVGALIKTDRWVEVPRGRIRVEVKSGLRASGVLVTVTF